ncbi:MAG TPA: heme peroxidase family protein [Thermoanaerobaculia bacterium]
MKTYPIRLHGVVRGLDRVPVSEQFEGRFGRMFRSLPAAKFSADALHKLAGKMIAEFEATPTPETEADDEENSGIRAGYTYLGQFIDHDLTFDPASSLQKQNDPDALVDFRTPRFDLDNVYGRGPDDQPYLYEEGGVRLLLGRALTGNAADPKAHDVQRNNPPKGPKRAIIGDPRNDENVIVSQLQATFLRFHNSVVDFLNDPNVDFATVQRLVRWHYQWVVLHDFLPTIVGQDMVDSILPHLKKGTSIHHDPPQLRFFRWRNDPFIPVEFSVAAYRFGHSMVRPIYRLNTTLADRQVIFSTKPGVPNLTGFQEFPDVFGIDWTLFFDFGLGQPPLGKTRIQSAYKIDTSLVNPLGDLPPSIAAQITSLAERNLLRGNSMGLPSGQDVARRMGVPVIPDAKLRVGKATEEDTPKNPHLVDVDKSFKVKAPLWYYILAEAQQEFKKNDTPIRLGPVGGRIVGEVFVGLLLGDRHSFLSQDPDFKPFPQFQKGGKFGMAQLITQALKA